jgi:hypothetical protein
MFLQLLLVKNCKILNNFATTEGGEEISADLEYLEFLEKL